MLGQVVGVRVFRAAIGMIGSQGAEQVEVDAMHGFRPKVDYPLGMTENLR